MPHERSRAVLGAAEVLKELLDPEKHPETTAETRRHIKWALRHYPDRSEINAVARICPDYFEYVNDAEAIKQGLKASRYKQRQTHNSAARRQQ